MPPDFVLPLITTIKLAAGLPTPLSVRSLLFPYYVRSGCQAPGGLLRLPSERGEAEMQRSWIMAVGAIGSEERLKVG